MAETPPEPTPPVAHTRTWLAKFHLRLPEVSVPVQRLVVVPLSWEQAAVCHLTRAYAEDKYAGEDVRVADFSAVALDDLGKLFDGMVTVTHELVDGHREHDAPPPDACPAELNIEMTYDDYSPLSQQTPSRLEIVAFPCLSLAREADKLVHDHEHLTTFVTSARGPYSDRSDNIYSGRDLAAQMLSEHYGKRERSKKTS